MRSRAERSDRTAALRGGELGVGSPSPYSQRGLSRGLRAGAGMVETSVEPGISIIEHLDFQPTCDVCPVWIEQGSSPVWEHVFPARWTGLLSAHGCPRMRKLLCDYHAAWRPYRCIECGAQDQQYEQLRPL